MSEIDMAERRGEVDVRLQELEERQAQHAERLTQLERFRERAYGALLTLSFIAGTGVVTFVAEIAGLL